MKTQNKPTRILYHHRNDNRRPTGIVTAPYISQKYGDKLTTVTTPLTVTVMILPSVSWIKTRISRKLNALLLTREEDFDCDQSYTLDIKDRLTKGKIFRSWEHGVNHTTGQGKTTILSGLWSKSTGTGYHGWNQYRHYCTIRIMGKVIRREEWID